MTNRKITKQDLLSICLGCDKCTSHLSVDVYGSIYCYMGMRSYVLVKKDNDSYPPYSFIEEDPFYETTRINTLEELKKAMRHVYYKYDV